MILKFFRIVLAGLAILALAGHSAAAAKPAGPARELAGSERPVMGLTLREAFSMGLANSRAVQSARFVPLQAEEDYRKAKTIYDPSVFLMSSAERADRPTQSLLDGVPMDSALLEDQWQIQAGFRNRLPTGGSLTLYQEGERLDSTSSYVFPDPQYQSRVVIALSQSLLKGFGDKEGATAIEVADLNRQVAEAAFQRDVVDVLMEIASHYWQLYFELNAVRVSRESLRRAEEVYQREKVRAEQGLLKTVDVDRALSAMKSRKNSLLRAHNQARLSMRQLWLILNPSRMFIAEPIPDLMVEETPQLAPYPWPRATLLASALTQRQELAIARDKVEISQRQQSLAGHNQLPVLDLKLSYGFSGLDDTQQSLASEPYDSEHNNWRVELGFEWPLGGRSAAAEKRKADYQLLQARSEMRLAAERIALEVDIVLDELRLAEEELIASREAMEAAHRVMSGEEVLFELGQKDNQDLLTVQDYYGSAEKDYLRAQARYNLNLVTLSRAKGTLLYDYGLSPVVADAVDGP